MRSTSINLQMAANLFVETCLLALDLMLLHLGSAGIFCARFIRHLGLIEVRKC